MASSESGVVNGGGKVSCLYANRRSPSTSFPTRFACIELVLLDSLPSSRVGHMALCLASYLHSSRFPPLGSSRRRTVLQNEAQSSIEEREPLDKILCSTRICMSCFVLYSHLAHLSLTYRATGGRNAFESYG
jgi:hypothetical protein